MYGAYELVDVQEDTSHDEMAGDFVNNVPRRKRRHMGEMRRCERFDSVPCTDLSFCAQPILGGRPCEGVLMRHPVPLTPFRGHGHRRLHDAVESGFIPTLVG